MTENSNGKQEFNAEPHPEELLENPAETTVSMAELLKQQLEKLKQETQEYKEKYFLTLAEIENMRKRLQKEKQDMTRFAVENVISEFLTPLDNLENALSFTDQMSEETRNWAFGFNMLLAQFKDVLNTHGVTSFSSLGSTFDPNLHEAVEIEESLMHPDNVVIHEFLKGYKRGDRVLRPARVKVSKKPKSEEPVSSEEQN
jgi:molecular chaperone GrpE